MKGQAVVLCGQCIVPPEVPENPKSGDEIVCPNCGSRDTVSRALSQARQHATHFVGRELDRKRIARGERVRSFVPTRAPVKLLRWISGYTGE